MKKAIFVILIFVFLPAASAKPPVWDSITNKTWVTLDCFAGAQITFYRTQNGLQKAIYQIYGSGVFVTASLIHDVEIKGDSIVLTNLLCLNERLEKNKTGDSEFVLIYHPERNMILLGSEETLNFKIDKYFPNIYNWVKSPASGEIIDFESLEKLPLEKNSIYDKELIENIKDSR